MKDYYRVLGVHPKAEPEVIKAAYNGLAKKYHPDLNPSPSATERMKEINEAHEVLSDPVRRAAYEREYVSHFGNEFSTDPPVLKVRPKTLNFGELAAGSKVEKCFVVENHGGPLKGHLNIDGSQCRGWATVSARPNSDDSDFPLEVTVEVDTANLPPGWVLGKIHQARILLHYLDEEIAVVLRLVVLPPVARRASAARPSGRSAASVPSSDDGCFVKGCGITIFLIVAIAFGIWFFFFTKNFFPGVGQQDRTEMMQQTEVDRLTSNLNQALEDIDLRMHLVSYDEDLRYINYAVYLRNNSDVKYTLGLVYNYCGDGGSVFLDPTQGDCESLGSERTLRIAPHSTESFDYGCSYDEVLIVPGVVLSDFCGFRMRIGAIDGISLGLSGSDIWHWEILPVEEDDGLVNSWFVKFVPDSYGGHYETIGPAYLDFDDPSKVIGDGHR